MPAQGAAAQRQAEVAEAAAAVPRPVEALVAAGPPQEQVLAAAGPRQEQVPVAVGPRQEQVLVVAALRLPSALLLSQWQQGLERVSVLVGLVPLLAPQQAPDSSAPVPFPDPVWFSRAEQRVIALLSTLWWPQLCLRSKKTVYCAHPATTSACQSRCCRHRCQQQRQILCRLHAPRAGLPQRSAPHPQRARHSRANWQSVHALR